MVMRTVKMLGAEISDATWTVVWDGVTVASGAVVAGAMGSNGLHQVVGTWTVEDNDVTELSEHSLSVTVNSGVLNVGTLWFSTDGITSDDDALGRPDITDATAIVGPGYWQPAIVAGGDPDTAIAERSNILLNGDVPTWAGDIIPTGSPDLTWNGWFFNIAAGDEFTCTGRCPAQWVAA